jgi:hypothetical protein
MGFLRELWSVIVMVYNHNPCRVPSPPKVAPPPRRHGPTLLDLQLKWWFEHSQQLFGEAQGLLDAGDNEGYKLKMRQHGVAVKRWRELKESFLAGLVTGR